MNELERHNREIHANVRSWEQKSVLRQCYKRFHTLIAAHLSGFSEGVVAELGSGIGNIKETIPSCLRTDLFANPWLDQIENAYGLSFADQSVADLILFDVFHHLRYPGTALAEFKRVLKPSGRLHIFEPRISLLGRLVYGACHPEPIAFHTPIESLAPADWKPDRVDYYAAQGNATRIFVRKEYPELLSDWRVVVREEFSALSYVLSGGYSKPQLYPTSWFNGIRRLEGVADLLPTLFATRLLVVLEPVTEPG